MVETLEEIRDCIEGKFERLDYDLDEIVKYHSELLKDFDDYGVQKIINGEFEAQVKRDLKLISYRLVRFFLVSAYISEHNGNTYGRDAFNKLVEKNYEEYVEAVRAYLG